MPPRATSSSNSYAPNSRGKVALPGIACRGASGGSPGSIAAKRHFTHSPRGASEGNARPHFGQTEVADMVDINDRYPFQLRSEFIRTFRAFSGLSGQSITQRSQQVTEFLFHVLRLVHGVRHFFDQQRAKPPAHPMN